MEERSLAHPDLDELLNALLPFAQEMLAKHGEFFPFGGSVATDGEIAHVGAHSGDERPPSQEVIDLLITGFAKQAKEGRIRAAAICLDVRTIPPGQSEKTDAICTRLEHVNGEAVDVFLPYRKGRLGKHKYGELFASKGEHYVFASPDCAA
jgi:hypothetical protein